MTRNGLPETDPRIVSGDLTGPRGVFAIECDSSGYFPLQRTPSPGGPQARLPFGAEERRSLSDAKGGFSTRPSQAGRPAIRQARTPALQEESFSERLPSSQACVPSDPSSRSCTRRSESDASRRLRRRKGGFVIILPGFTAVCTTLVSAPDASST